MSGWHALYIEQPDSGVALAALHYRLTDPQAPLLIVCHGFTGCKEGDGRHLRFAEFLALYGWQTVLFDFAGNGQSEGDFAASTLATQMADLRAVVDWAQAFAPRRIACLGRSFGGTTAICQAARDTRVQAVCTWAAPARLQRLFAQFRITQREGQCVLRNAAGSVVVAEDFFEVLERIDPLREVSRLTPRPYWCVHGTEDDTVPMEDGRLLYAAAQQPKAVYWVSGGDHQLHAQTQEVWRQTQAWLDEWKTSEKASSPS
ncbi:MAG: alpha/beta hydrolase [Desulfohalobium sp.]